MTGRVTCGDFKAPGQFKTVTAQQFGVGQDRADVTVGDDKAGVHHYRSVAQLGGVGQIVGDDEHRRVERR